MKKDVVLIGKPNVGKSTLFNRLVDSRRAVVSDIPGTTVDRSTGICRYDGREIRVVDLAGLPIDKNNKLKEKIDNQVAEALSRAKIVVYVGDVVSGWGKEDMELLKIIRKHSSKYIAVINKVDNRRREVEARSFFGGKFADAENAFYISALHGRGVNELLNAFARFFTFKSKNEQRGSMSVAVIGRPNVGKSTLFNALLKKERSIVFHKPGTTRDSVHERFFAGGKLFNIIDTAGVSKKSKVTSIIEQRSIGSTHSEVRRSDAVILIIDGEVGPSRQDIKLLQYAKTRKKNILIVVNKWDKLGGEDSLNIEAAQSYVLNRFPFLAKYKIVPISALKKWNLKKIINWLERLPDSSGV